MVSSGYKGVDIFFVISGFVMYYTLFAKKRPDAIHFTVNRVTKIFFLYWVALIWLYFVDPQKFQHLGIKSILLIPSHKSLLGVSWSLSFELYFYFLIGTIAYLISEKYHKLIFILLLSITSIVTLIDLFTPKLQHTTINYVLGPNFWEFLLGILCAYLSITYHKRITFLISITISTICLILFLVISVTYMNPISYVIYGPLSCLVVLFLTAFEQVKSIYKKLASIFKIIGDASYGIYLFGPIITLMINPNLFLAKNLLVIFSTITVSILFNVFIENRFLLFVRKTLYARFPKK
jgi:peptidoglycan/LPS O-acetylase OafA/YrhL